MKFDWFVVPFSVGLVSLIIYLLYRYIRWIKQLPVSSQHSFFNILFSFKFFRLIGEIFMEVLLHRRIFRIHPVLGYMHSSFAFGWFLLILFGAIEAHSFGTPPVNPLYEPIFFKYFNHHAPYGNAQLWMAFLMDLFLLYVLSGLLLAIIKRFYSRTVGMKRTTRLYWTDKIALYSLWLIFPLRLLAESSTTAIYQNGSFLTNNTGTFLEQMFSISSISVLLWWAYSIDLMIFFVFLPTSRYMHIPTEMILIALRHCGFKTEKTFTAFSAIEVNACSSCGICIDNCQLQSVLGRNQMVPSYLFQKERHKKVLKTELYDCLICGRCEEVCPVNINILNIKLSRRSEKVLKRPQNYAYLTAYTPEVKSARVAYFAGCMSQLTPSITKAMMTLFEKSNTHYAFLDKEQTICCGRPLMLSGKFSDAQKLIEKNTELIVQSGAAVLLTSCPICFKVFNEDYALPIPVLHHSQWLANQIKEHRLQPSKLNLTAAYHDPCDLGRGSKIYEEPRTVLSACINLNNKAEYQKENSLCCGGSLGNFYAKENDRVQLAEQSYQQLMNGEDVLVTSCPLCKKTFQKIAEKPVLDLAEIMVMSVKNRHNFL